MALILPNSTCVLCGKPLGRSYTATSGCAFGPDHRLWKYCDAPMHLECLAAWPDRKEFSQGYHEMIAQHHAVKGQFLAETDRWALTCGPAGRWSSPYFAQVTLTDWPFRLYSHWEAWDKFVAGGYGKGLSGQALAAADAVMAEVKAIAPDLKSLAKLRRASFKQ